MFNIFCGALTMLLQMMKNKKHVAFHSVKVKGYENRIKIRNYKLKEFSNIKEE